MPDFECTLFFDGIPHWLGGTGDEWLHCCVAHDLVSKSTEGDMELWRCVAEVSPIMGAVMGIGVLTLGTVYVALKKLQRRK